MRLVKVDHTNESHLKLLYQLLEERPLRANISHNRMPSKAEHRDFVRFHHYREWFIFDYGAIYLTDLNEIGVATLKEHQGKGYARKAIELIVRLKKPLPEVKGLRCGHFIANINPDNKASIKLFEGLGFRHIQNTYRLGG